MTRTATGGDVVSETRDDADEDEPAVVDEPAVDDVAPRDTVRAREIVLLVVAVLAVAGMVFFGLRWKELHDEQLKRQDVEQAAGQFLNTLFEWDGQTVDEDFDAILDFATGDFEEEAQATFADDATRQELREKQAASRAENVDIFVRSIHGDDARVFAVVDVTAVNEDYPDRRADTVRIEIGMHKTGGEWKVYDVNLLDGLNLGLPADPTTDATTATTTPAG